MNSIAETVTPPRCLTIAGSDSGGCAGVQADLKTFSALGVFGTTVLTALTSQNTNGVNEIAAVEPRFVADQLETTLSDIGCDAFKSGMLHNAPVIEAIVQSLRRLYPVQAQQPPFVLDPVMVATSGRTLLDDSAIDILRDQLVPMATIITPNLPEARILAGRPKLSKELSMNRQEMEDLAKEVASLGCGNVLLKGGHAEGDDLFDLLYDAESMTSRIFPHRRVQTSSTHGTGCTLSSALCAYLAKGLSVLHATQSAIDFVQGALRAAFPLGHGKGPVNHLYNVVERPISLPTAGLPHPFTSYLMRACHIEWEGYVWNNPFIQGLRDGTLPMSSFTHFLKQDYHFLLHYARVHALAAYKCDTFEEMAGFTEIIEHILRESRLHVHTCAKQGISFEDILAEPEGNMTVAYTRFVLDIGQSKSLLHLRVATAPCLLGYGEVGRRLLADPALKRRDNPYMYWIEEYGGEPFQTAVRTGVNVLESIVARESVSPAVLEELTGIFAKATRLECGFWEQALTQNSRVKLGTRQ